jgi:RyR and IP3R Homology associated
MVVSVVCCTVSICVQNYLRGQSNKTNYNMVGETLQFLDCICGSTTGGLGLLGLYINEINVHLVIQTLESLTEYCQGPCHENQVGHRSFCGCFSVILGYCLL